MNYPDDEIVANSGGYPLPRTSWAHVKDGVILGVSLRYDGVHSPFEGVPVAQPGHIPLAGEFAVVVTGTGAMSGHLIDRHGNTTPNEGRTEGLEPGQAAYHDGAAAHAVHGVQADEGEPGTEVSEPTAEAQEGENHGETHDDAAE